MQRCALRCLLSSQHARRAPGSRCAYSIIAALPSQRVEIARPGATSVPIVIHQPLIAARSSTPTVVLYFPRGPVLHSSEVDHEVIKILRSTLPCHIIEVQYRFDKDHRHPSAVYDSTTAFDWAVQNVLTGKLGHKGRVATCGELVGGNLAATLALTECRAGQPSVVAAVVNNPVLDWVDLEVKRRGGRRKKNELNHDVLQPPIPELHSTRSRLFRKPEDYYDPFASPMLFFRSAGSVPADSPKTPDEHELHFYDHETEQVHHPASNTPEVSVDIDVRPRSSRQFPSRAHGLKLPAFYISTGSNSSLAFQAEEFVSQFRQSVLRQKKARVVRRSRWAEDSFHDHDPLYMSEEEFEAAEVRYLNSRVTEKIEQGAGLWSDPTSGPAMIHDMANWLRQQLVP